MSRCGPLAKHPSGFTLVELLLAVTLMGILLALAYGGLRAATQATERGQVLLEEAGSVRSAHQFIRRQVNQMMPLPFDVSDDAEEVRIVFRGDSQRIQFVGPMPGYLGSGGPQVQVLEIVPGEEGDELLFTHALLQEFEPEHLLERDPIVLLDGIDQASFQFLTRDEEGRILGWTPAWEAPGELPVAVMLDVVLPDESPVTWPLLATGVRVDAAAARLGGTVRSYEDRIQEMITNPGGED